MGPILILDTNLYKSNSNCVKIFVHSIWGSMKNYTFIEFLKHQEVCAASKQLPNNLIAEN